MSYLEPPRLYFAGRIHVDVPTVNNFDPYFNNDWFEPRFQWALREPDLFGDFNPVGSGAFRLRGCRVTGVVHPDGRYASSPDDDPIIGAHLSEDNKRVSAKIVDLHPHYQLAAALYGLRLRLQNKEGVEFLKADFDPAAAADIWMRKPPPLHDVGGIYQSTLSDVQWSGLASPFLSALREAAADGRLSIKLNVAATYIEPGDPNFLYGNVTGSIGIHHAGEPQQFVAARRLRQVDDSPLNEAPCLIDDGGTVHVDLGNSIPVTKRGGPYSPIGRLRLAVLVDGAPQILGPLDGWVGNAPAIASLRLTPAQVELAQRNALAVVDAADPPQRLLAENAEATYVRADTFVFRIYPGTAAHKVKGMLHATRFGKPAAGMNLKLWVGGDGNFPPLEHPETVTTGDDGRAEFWTSSEGPGVTQPYIDGEVALLYYGFANRPNPRPEGFAAVRVFDRFDPPKNPNWVRDIQPIFQRYANLFPSMQRVFDLGNYNHVVKYRTTIRATMLLPMTAPNYMPVTRDLSPGKRDMIMKWLEAAPLPAVLDISTVEDLRMALQQALLLEQAVIPPYLAALLSIKPNQNIEVADIIDGVLREEMLHLALVGNLLNAVGGKPQIGRPGLVPTYPGRLPAPVLPDLNVRLRKCTVEHVRDVFLAIELPQQPMVDGRRFGGRVIDRKSLSVDARGNVLKADQTEMTKLTDFFGKAEYEPMTVGWFYTQIARALLRLSRSGTLFTGNPARQVSWPTAPGTLYRITDLRSALLAIHEIIEQGEGTPQNLDDDPDPEKLGHYYRFQQIVHGRRLIKNRNGKWVYEGAPVRLDPQGVYPMEDDPDAYRNAPDSLARRESELFNEMYTKVLTSLNDVFNGKPDTLPDAVGLMFSLQVQAKKLFDLPTSPGAATVVGPAFQSPSVVLD
jgi:hypothetical protein